MYLLAIDTADRTCSAAVATEKGICSSVAINNTLTHSENLLPIIDQALTEAKIKFTDIERIAVTVGPGSFTGVKIGVSTAKGLAAPRNTPCVALSSLEALAFGVKGFDGIIGAMLDARRGECYGAIFSRSGNSFERLTEDMALPASEFEAKLKEYSRPVCLCGASYLINNPDFISAHEEESFISAANVASAFFSGCGDSCSPTELLPTYVRIPQAERELAEKKDRKENSK